MSWQARLLNPWLRLTEKTHLARARDPRALRRSFEIKARVFFHAPFGTRMAWRTLGTGRALEVTPRGPAGGLTILYFHGGGYVFGSPRTHAAMLATLARRAGAVAILPEYPLAPEAPFPAALDRALDAYHACLADGADPAHLVLGGDSAGGGLVLALLARLIADGAPLPAGVFAFSPLTDLRYSGDSFTANARADVVLPAARAADMVTMYLAGHSPDDPGASPLYADFTGAGPVWLAVGDTEILLDDSRRMADRLAAQAVPVTLTVEADLPHVWPIFHNILPEGRATLEALSVWIRDQANVRPAQVPRPGS
jgi:acetyl esterase/lipase